MVTTVVGIQLVREAGSSLPGLDETLTVRILRYHDVYISRPESPEGQEQIEIVGHYTPREA